jgi:hypothetical protein
MTTLLCCTVILLLCAQHACSVLCYPKDAVVGSVGSETPFVLKNIVRRTQQMQYASQTVTTQLSTSPNSTAYADAYDVCLRQCLTSATCVGFQVAAFLPNITCNVFYGVGISYTTGVVFSRCQSCQVVQRFVCPVTVNADNFAYPQFQVSNGQVVGFVYYDALSTNNNMRFPVVDVTLYVSGLRVQFGAVTKFGVSDLEINDGTNRITAIVSGTFQILVLLFVLSGWLLTNNAATNPTA